MEVIKAQEQIGIKKKIKDWVEPVSYLATSLSIQYFGEAAFYYLGGREQEIKIMA